MNNSIPVHYNNLQCLAAELYKVFNGMFPDIIKDVMKGNRSTFYVRPVNLSL